MKAPRADEDEVAIGNIDRSLDRQRRSEALLRIAIEAGALLPHQALQIGQKRGRGQAARVGDVLLRWVHGERAAPRRRLNVQVGRELATLARQERRRVSVDQTAAVEHAAEGARRQRPPSQLAKPAAFGMQLVESSAQLGERVELAREERVDTGGRRGAKVLCKLLKGPVSREREQGSE